MRNYGIRLTAEGAEAVEADLKGIGRAGREGMDRLGTAARGASNSVRLVGQEAGRVGRNVQNFGFQIGDFATQVGAGTSATQALGQQLPQLLGGFGPLGAVMGAVAAIGIPLGAALFNVGSAADGLGGSAENARDSAENFFDLIEGRSEALAELTRQFGGAAGTARQLADAQIELSASIARADVSAAIDQLRDLDGFFSGLFQDSGRAFDPAVESARDLASELGFSEQAAFALSGELRAVFDAGTDREKAASLNALNAEIVRLRESGEQFSAEGRVMAQTLYDAGTAANILAANTDGAGAAALNAAGSYFELADAISRARAEQSARIVFAAGPSGATEDSRNSNDRGINLTYDDRREVARLDAAAARRAGGGGRGLSDVEREAERQEKHIAKLKLDAQRDYWQDVRDLQREELDRIAEVNAFVAESFTDMFTGAITGANSLKESLADLVAELGKMALSRGFMGLLAGSGFGGSAAGGFLSDFFGIGAASSFAGGGYTGNGPRSGGVDGQGGFWAVMHPREQVVDLTRGGGMGGMHVTVGVAVDDEGGLRAYVKSMARSEVRNQAPGIVGQSVNAVDRRMKTSNKFGRGAL